jgi:cell filamentation protein
MKESLILKHLDFISFVQETEGYRVSQKAEHLARLVLDDYLSGDQAVLSVLESYGLKRDEVKLSSEDGLYPDSDIYINYLDLKDQEFLDSVETEVVSCRMAQILATEQEWSFDFDHLKYLHKVLLGDIYPFAGLKREISITKRTLFCLPKHIDSVATDIFAKLKEQNYLKDQHHEIFVDNLAYYMAEIHALHPFLDGNTRAMRLFFQQLSNNANWEMDFGESETSHFLQADIASLEGDYQPLISFLLDAVQPL